jgi:hypothetical protein
VRTCLVFDTLADAQSAAAIIDARMGYPAQDGDTLVWHSPQQRVTDSKWYIFEPPVSHEEGELPAHTHETFSKDWLPGTEE